MTEEEQETIDLIKNFISIKIIYGNTFVMYKEQLQKYQLAASKLLSLIEKQKVDLKKKDKIIDLMAEYIEEEDITSIFCENKKGCDEKCKPCINQYFEKEVEEK